MRRDLILAHLLAMRSAIDALVLEFTEGQEEKCCDNPQLQTLETYSGREVKCMNCGAISKAGPDKVSGEPVNQTK